MENEYLAARKTKFSSRELAAEELGLAPTRVAELENGAEPRVGEVISMAFAYNEPRLMLRYCRGRCPVGRARWSAAEEEARPVRIGDTATRLLTCLHRIGQAREDFYNILGDSALTEEELPLLDGIIGGCSELEDLVDELRVWALERSGVRALLPAADEAPAEPPYRAARERAAADEPAYQHQLSAALAILRSHDEEMGDPIKADRSYGNELGRLEKGEGRLEAIPLLAKAYRAPELLRYPCSRCELGRIFCRAYVPVDELGDISFKVLSVSRQIDEVQDRLTALLSDLAIRGREEELQFVELLRRLDDIVHSLDALRVYRGKTVFGGTGSQPA